MNTLEIYNVEEFITQYDISISCMFVRFSYIFITIQMLSQTNMAYVSMIKGEKYN